MTDKEGQLEPVVEQILNGLEAGVGLNLSVIQLPAAPGVQLIHQRKAMLLVETQALIGIKPLLARQGIIMKDLSQRLQHVTALGGKAVHDVDEVAAAMRQAVGHDDSQRAGSVARKRVTHLNRGLHILGAPI